MPKMLLILWLLLFPSFASAAVIDSPPAGSRLLLLSAYAQARQMGDRAAKEIARLDAEIAKNQASMNRSETIISLARQRADADARKAEAVARQALENAAQAKRWNESARRKWELARERAATTLAAIRGRFAGGAGAATGIPGLLTARSGQVRVLKADGREAAAEGGFLQQGDRLLIEEGRAELNVLDGRGNVVIGPGTEIELAEDSPTEQVLGQLGGRIHVAVEKSGEFMRRMSAWLAEFGEDARTMAGADLAEIELALKRYKRKIELRYRGYRTTSKITIVIGVRGTKFSAEAMSDGSLAVTVLDGMVDLGILELERTVTVSAGEQAIVDRNGTIRVERTSRMDAWWEEPAE
jgi:hypothetical protein